MKLSLSFDSLWQNVNQMGASRSAFELNKEKSESFALDNEGLSRGVEISLSALEPVGGVLSIQGMQVLLYIPDQGGSIESVLKDGSKGKKFHVANCSTLHKMRAINRIERYIVTNDLSGNFNVHGSNYRIKNEGTAKLVVCKNCLNHTNYKGYKNGSYPGPTKGKIFKEFNLSEFFARHSTLFDHTPTQLEQTLVGYSEDWTEVSQKYRSSKNYCCEQCKADFSEHNYLLHSHHINGVKRDNSDANLQALCADCHRKQPMHQHMSISAKQMDTIYKLRREQGLFDDNTWDELLELTDTSFHGILQTYRHNGKPRPEVGYDVENSEQEVVITAEVAWALKKKAIVFNAKEVDILTTIGWSAITLNEAVDNAAHGHYLV